MNKLNNWFIKNDINYYVEEDSECGYPDGYGCGDGCDDTCGFDDGEGIGRGTGCGVGAFNGYGYDNIYYE